MVAQSPYYIMYIHLLFPVMSSCNSVQIEMGQTSRQMAQYICDVVDPEHKHTSREHTGNNNLNAERATASLDSKHEANTLHQLSMLRNTWY